MEQNSEHPTDRDLILYIDEGIQSSNLIEHISRCPRCAERLNELKNSFDIMTNPPESELSALLRARIMRSFVEYRKSGWSFGRLWTVRIPLYQVAGIVAAVALLMHFIGSKVETADTRNTTALSFHQTLQESLLGP